MAVLQIELDRARLIGHDESFVGQYGNDQDSSTKMINNLLGRALRDTIRNGGTFVVVVSETTITAIQHEDAKPLEGPANE